MNFNPLPVPFSDTLLKRKSWPLPAVITPWATILASLAARPLSPPAFSKATEPPAVIFKNPVPIVIFLWTSTQLPALMVKLPFCSEVISPLISTPPCSECNVNVPLWTLISAVTFTFFLAEILTPIPLAKAVDNVLLLTVCLLSARILLGESPLSSFNWDWSSLPLLMVTLSGSNNHSFASTAASLPIDK